MKVIIIDIPLKNPDGIKKLNYSVDGNISIQYDGSICFPITGVMARKLEENDVVKVLMLTNKYKDSQNDNLNFTKKNIEKFKEELESVNKVNAVFNYIEIEDYYDEAKSIHENRFKKIVNELKDCSGAEIFTDITYGQKTLPIIQFAALNFAEKYLDSDIKYIVYGQAIFENNVPIRGTVFDVTSLYYMLNITNGIEVSNGKTAVNLINKLFCD